LWKLFGWARLGAAGYCGSAPPRRHLVTSVLILTLFLASAPSAIPQSDATEEDVAKLQADLQNLEADLGSIAPEAISSAQRERVERIREEAIYIKVKARKHQEEGGKGTGISRDEVRDLRLDISDLRNEIRPQIARSKQAETSTTIPAGTEIELRLEDLLSSETANPGDRFTATAAAPVLRGNAVAIEAGSLFRGRVESVDRVGGRTDRTAKLLLVVDELEQHGKSYDVAATVVGASERLETGLGSEVKKIGIGAGLGSVLGAILGGKKGAVIGATVGGGGAILGTTGNEVELPSGTILQLRLDRDLTLPAPGSASGAAPP
jgi:hypothetical protein